MQRDREEDERKARDERLGRIRDTREWQEEGRKALLEERQAKGKGYSQSIQISYHEFLKWRGWDERDVDELSDIFVFTEWRIYSLKLQYGISL